MSCSDLSTNIEIKTATKKILNNIYKYSSNSDFIEDSTNIFGSNFTAKYENINNNLNNIDENDGKENLATIVDDDVYINCVYQSSLPWYTTSEDKKKCEIISDIKLPENRLILDKKSLTVTPIFKSANKEKSGFCTHQKNVNTAYCENRWYDWIIIPNYYLGNTYYKDNSQYTELDVYKCYAPCEGDNMPYTKSTGELKCIPKKYFSGGIFNNKYMYSAFGLINLIGNIALSDIEKNNSQTNLLYILHQLLIEYNLENNYDKELYQKNKETYTYINNFVRTNYDSLYEEFKKRIDNNIFFKFSTSIEQDYSRIIEFNYKHRKFNEDETEMYSYNGLDACKVIIDPILIHTWMLANLFQPLSDDIIRETKINSKIITSSDDDKVKHKKYAKDGLLYEKLLLIFNDKDKAIRLKNIFFKAVNICYNSKTNFSVNIIENTKIAFTNEKIIDFIITNKFYNFTSNIFFYNYLCKNTSEKQPAAFPFNIDTADEIPKYVECIKYIFNQDRFEEHKEYELKKDVDIEEYKKTYQEEAKTSNKSPLPYNELYFTTSDGDDPENLWKYKYYYSMERLERPTCARGYEWNSKYKTCDLIKQIAEVDNSNEKNEEDDFNIPELKNIFNLFIKIIIGIIILYMIYVFYDIFSEVIFSFFNAIFVYASSILLGITNNSVSGETEYDKEVKRLENTKQYIENTYKNIEKKEMKIDEYLKTHKLKDS